MQMHFTFLTLEDNTNAGEAVGGIKWKLYKAHEEVIFLTDSELLPQHSL